MYVVYILRCFDKTLYTGITTDMKRRLAEHQRGVGGRYTRAKKPVALVYSERRLNRSTASKREAEIKRLSRDEKLALIAKHKKRRSGTNGLKKPKRMV